MEAKEKKKAKLDAERKKKEDERRIALVAGIKQRKLDYKTKVVQQAKKDDGEQAVRDEIMLPIIERFKESTALLKDHKRQLREAEEWRVYLAFDEGPDPKELPELTSALYRWREDEAKDTEFLLAKQRDLELKPILKALGEIISYSTDVSPARLQLVKEVHTSLCEEMARTLEEGTRTWSRTARSHQLGQARHAHAANLHSVAAWLEVPLPLSKPKQVLSINNPPVHIPVHFPEMGIHVTLPGTHNWRETILRALWEKHDRLSPHSPEFGDPPLLHVIDLYTHIKEEYDGVVRLRKEQQEARTLFFKDLDSKMATLQAAVDADKFGALKDEREELNYLSTVEPDPVLIPRDILMNQEGEEHAAMLEQWASKAEAGVINLRSHRTLGGVIIMEMLRQPARTKWMRGDLTITLLESSANLTEVEFLEAYRPPPAPAPGTVRKPEDMEADMRAQEAALERLLLVDIVLPNTVLWLEPPSVCCWDSARKCWTTEDILDSKYNEDKFTVAFRIGPISFASLKYCNLPYQGWELKPTGNKAGVVITMMGAIIVLELEVTAQGIRVLSLQNGATEALQDMVNKFFTLPQLKERLQTGGVDFFPTADAPNVIEGTCCKLPALEHHLYYCMAHFCTSYNFTWSRWNATAGRRAIVQQIREHSCSPNDNYDILHATPEFTAYVKSTEVSPEYIPTPLDSMKFFPDLFSLVQESGSTDARNKIGSMPWMLIEVVKEILWSMKPFSYS